MRAGDALVPRRLRPVIWAAILATQLFYVVLIMSGLLPAAAAPVGRPYLVIVVAAVACAFGLTAHVLWLRAGRRDEHVARAGEKNTPLIQVHIAVWALDEGIGIVALALAVLGYGPVTWAIFCAAGILLTLVHYPG